MGIVYFMMNKFAELFFGNETTPEYEMMEDVYDYDYEEYTNYDNDHIVDFNDDQWFYGHVV